ncbi:MAG TPA: hypothetical protein VGD74_01385 [Vulgatibacter sp.]
MKVVGSFHLFGVVIANDAVVGPWKNCVLAYLYDLRSEEPVAPGKDDFLRAELLVPPFITNRVPWLEGYFETVGLVDVGGIRMGCHSFRHPIFGYLMDEYGNTLREPCGVVGEWSLMGYRGVAKEVLASVSRTSE